MNKDELGYDVYYKIIDAKSLFPQHRERIYIIGIKHPTDFTFPILPYNEISIENILEEKPDEIYTLTEGCGLFKKLCRKTP